jgi:integrase
VPRPLTGRIVERRLVDDRLAFDAIIRRRQVLIGYAPEWSRRRAEHLLQNVLVPRARLGEPWWEELERSAPSASPHDPDAVTFAEAASEYVNRVQSQYENPSTLNAYLSPVLKHVGPFFAYDGERLRTVAEISGTLVSAFTRGKMQEREILSDLADTLAELDDEVLRDAQSLRAQLDSPHEWEVLVRYGQRAGRVPLAQALADGHCGRISLSSRGLSNNEINRCLARLRDVLDLAREEFGVDIGDPTRKRGLPRVEPARSWLRPFHLQAIFDAADELDARAPARGGADYRLLGRKPLVVLLGLAGPRVSEVGGATWAHTHLDGGSPYLHIPEAKTSAGQRDVRLHAVVRDALADRKATLNPRGTDPVFATARGGRRDRNSIRNRLLNPVLSRAGELLTERSLPPLPDRVTPHTFRRTYLTYLAWAGVPIRRAMSQAGHKDAKLTLQIYQQDFPDDPSALAQVKAWLGVE